MKQKIASVLCLWALAFSVPAFAATDDGLYGAPAPEGSAFFRFIEADANRSMAVPQINAKKFSSAAFKTVTPYYPTQANHVKFTFGGKSTDFALAPGKYYTVALNKEGLVVLTDKSLMLKARAIINFYNFAGEGKLSLRLADQNINVVDALNSGETRAREINPVTLTLGVYDENDKQIAKLSPITLERGHSYSVIAFKNAEGKTEILSSEAKIDAKK